MRKRFFYFTLVSISMSLVGAQQAQEEQKIEKSLPADHTVSHALHGIIDNDIPSSVVGLIGQFMGDYKKIKILKPDRPFFQHRPLNIKEQVNSISLAPDGIHLASVSEDEEIIRIWNSDSGKCIQRCTGSHKLNSIHWSRHGLLASASNDRSIWLPLVGTFLYSLRGQTDTVKWSPNAIQLASASHSTVDVYTESDRHLKVAEHSEVPERKIKYLNHSKTLKHERRVQSVNWLSDHKLITTCNNKIRIWNPSTAECLAVFEDPDGLVYTAQGSPGGKFIASYGKTVRVLEAQSGELLEVIPKACLPLHWLSEDVLAVTLEEDNSALKNLDKWSPSSDSVTRFNARSEESRTEMKKRRIGIFNLSLKDYDVLGGEYYLEGNASRRRANVWAVFENGLFTSIDSSQAGRIVAGCDKGTISIWDPASKYLVELCDPEVREQLQTMNTPVRRAIKGLQEATKECIIL